MILNQKVEILKKFLNKTEIDKAFKLIFIEILEQKIPEDNVFTYTAFRLREIGKELREIE